MGIFCTPLRSISTCAIIRAAKNSRQIHGTIGPHHSNTGPTTFQQDFAERLCRYRLTNTAATTDQQCELGSSPTGELESFGHQILLAFWPDRRYGSQVKIASARGRLHQLPGRSNPPLTLHQHSTRRLHSPTLGYEEVTGNPLKVEVSRSGT